MDAGESWTEPSPPACPVWLELALVIAISAVVSFGGFGLLLADLGHYSAALAFTLGAAGTVAGTALARPRQIERSPLRRGVTAPALGACAVALVQLVWNAVDATHHVVSGMDPGVYLLTGKWLAQHGNLVVPAGSVWSGKGDMFSLASSGVYQMPNGTLQFQFAHMLGVLLADADKVGGDRLMFRMPAVLGALGLLTVYAVGCRLIRRPWLVLAAIAGLAVCLPELNVTRDTFSEPLTQILLWGGILLLLRAYSVRSEGIALLAGVAIGGTLMTHIDAAIYLVPLPPLAALALITARVRDDRRSIARLIGFGFLGLAPTAILGTLDVWYRAGQYYDDLSGQMHSVYKLLGLSTGLSVVVTAVWMASPSLARKASALASRYRNRVGVAAACVVGGGLVLAWAIRPLFPTERATGAAGGVARLQAYYGLAIQPNRTYSEQTLRWFEWYIGPVALALAVIGFCILVVRAIRAGSVIAIVLLTMLGGITALYLWNPEVNPLQIWATRRFATAAFPLFMLAAALAIDYGATTVGRHSVGRAWPRLVTIAAAAGLVLFPLATTWPVRSFSSQANWLPLIERACNVIGPNAAVVVPPVADASDLLPMTYEDWCHVPVATLDKPTTAAQLAYTVAQFGREGRALWILGPSAQAITSAVPGLTVSAIGSAESSHELPDTLINPPQSYTRDLLTIYAARIP